MSDGEDYHEISKKDVLDNIKRLKRSINMIDKRLSILQEDRNNNQIELDELDSILSQI